MSDSHHTASELEQLALEFEQAGSLLQAQRSTLLGLLQGSEAALSSPPSPQGLQGVEDALRARDLQLRGLEEKMGGLLERAKRAAGTSQREQARAESLNSERTRLLELLGAEQDRSLLASESGRRAGDRLHQAERELQTLRAQNDQRSLHQEAFEQAHRTALGELETLRQSLDLARQELLTRTQRGEAVERWLEQERQRGNELESTARLAQEREGKANEHLRGLELRLVRVELERDNAVHEAQSRQADTERAQGELQRFQSDTAQRTSARERELAELKAENLRLRAQAARLVQVEDELRQHDDIGAELELELGRRRAQLTDLSEQLAQASRYEAEAYRLGVELERYRQEQIEPSPAPLPEGEAPSKPLMESEADLESSPD